MASFFWSTTSQFDEAVDRATDSQRLLAGAEDIALNLEISDQIRSKSIPPKDAMRSLKRRLDQKNPNVQLLALNLIDVCVKNGGDHFLAEIASREFMDNLVSILKVPALNRDVKEKILRLVQNLAVAFEGKPSLSYVGEVYKTLGREGFNFPPKDPALTSSAMVDTQTAPEWIDSDVCLRCRTPFSFTNRKHHCRNCGQVYDQACSSKVLALPHFGITQEVRVCDSCYTKLSKAKRERRHSADDHQKDNGKLKKLDRSTTTVRHKSAREVADEELQRAIALSLEEAHANRSNIKHSASPLRDTWSRLHAQSSEPPLVDQRTRSNALSEDDDPELRAAIEASLREASAPRPSAPVVEDVGPQGAFIPTATLPALPSYDLHPQESDAILTFSQTVEEVHSQGDRDFSRHPVVTELYDRATGLRPKLARSLDDTDRKEQLLAEMNDKLSQAVKLYDSLLTEQLSHPSWRYSTASTRQPIQQYSYAVPSVQYAPQRVSSPTQMAAPPLQREASYVNSSFSRTQTGYSNHVPQQYQANPVENPPQVQYQQYHHQQPYAQPPQQPSQPQYASPPAPAPVQLAEPKYQYQPQSPSIAPVHIPQTPYSNSNAQPEVSSPTVNQVQQFEPPAPRTKFVPPPPIPIQSNQPAQYYSQPASSPAQPQYQNPVSPPSVQYTAPAQLPHQYQQHAAASPPLASYVVANPAPNIPYFPSVPSAPLPVAQPTAPEPKEAMLISFD